MSPLYGYLCHHCGIEGDEIFAAGSAPKTSKCPHCGHRRSRTYSPPQISIFAEYTTPHITGEPVHVSSRGQERELLQRHGLTRVTSDEMTSDMRQRKPKMPSLAKMYQEEGKIECLK